MVSGLLSPGEKEERGRTVEPQDKRKPALAGSDVVELTETQVSDEERGGGGRGIVRALGPRGVMQGETAGETNLFPLKSLSFWEVEEVVLLLQ